MEAELIAARQRIFDLEAELHQCLTHIEQVRTDARRLYSVQHQLRNDLFEMQRRLDNYALGNSQLARQIYPPPPHTTYPAHEVVTIDFL